MSEDAIDVRLLPEVYEGTDARVMRWLRAVGDMVALNDPLVEVETDKVTVEIAAPADGRLACILKHEADSVVTGDTLARIEPQAGAGPSPAPPGARATMRPAPPTPATAPGGKSAQGRLSPAVRTLLQERGLDAAAVTGSGREGRITARDVEEFTATGARSRRVPHTAMRRRIAENMSRSVASAPHVTAVFEADMSAVVAHREHHRREFAAHGVQLSYTAYFLAACVPAFRAMPEINSRFHADALEIFDDLDIGIGTALGAQGLIVPVMRRVQEMDLLSIARALGDLLDKARSGKLSAEDMKGGTFTISNHGVSGSLFATPIIHQPQSAILGVGKLERRAAVVDLEGSEAIRVCPKCYVSLTIDHRAIDGYQANAFLTAWVGCLESWPIDS